MAMKYAFFTLVLVTTFSFSQAVSAQVPTLGASNVDVTMIPENPRANQSVSVSVVSYSTDINAASITWKINGRTMLSGTGKKAFSFTVGSVNNTTTLDIIISTAEGDTIQKSYTIRPVDVDLIW